MNAAEDRVPFYDEVASKQYSPLNSMIVQQFYEREHNEHQIWLVSSADPSKRHLLFTHERYAEVLFSPDEKWLVINDHRLSNQTNLLLFRQKAPLEYEQVEDLSEASWNFFFEQNKPNKGQFDHSYVEALQWANEWGNDEPPTLLLYLHAHLDSHNYTGPWYCLYDVKAKKFSVDFAAHNKKTTKLTPE